MNDPHSAHFFLQGYAGTGKTFLYQTICHHFRAQVKIVLCVASSRIAALLLPGGTTSHSRFRIPLDIHENSICNIRKGSQLAALIEKTDLIIWDEVPMQHKYCFDAVSTTLADILGNELPFGGIPVILGGDFAQILPVIPKGSRASIVAQQSKLWRSFTVLHLRRNMRLRPGPRNEAFAEWIHSLSYTPAMYGRIEIPGFVRTTTSVEALIEKVFPLSAMQQAHEDSAFFQDRAILTTRNDTVAQVNDCILERPEHR
jgi:PIF1-like helicase